jgi:inner membrane protein
MPFNTLLWRVVAMTPDGYVEGERSLAADSGPMAFRAHGSDVRALRAARDIPAARRLAWFTHGFQKAELRNGQLLLSDLRMGSEPDYSFRFVVAARRHDRWHALQPPRQLRLEWKSPRGVDGLWRRIWSEPVQPRVQAAIGNSGGTPATSASK